MSHNYDRLWKASFLTLCSHYEQSRNSVIYGIGPTMSAHSFQIKHTATFSCWCKQYIGWVLDWPLLVSQKLSQWNVPVYQVFPFPQSSLHTRRCWADGSTLFWESVEKVLVICWNKSKYSIHSISHFAKGHFVPMCLHWIQHRFVYYAGARAGHSCSPDHELVTPCSAIFQWWILVACMPKVQELSGILAAEASSNPYDRTAIFNCFSAMNWTEIMVSKWWYNHPTKSCGSLHMHTW